MIKLKKQFVDKEIDLGLFSQILHMSDIHIRPLQRHEEFNSVFQTLGSELSKLCSKKKSIIAITGDVFDNKTVFKPETFQLCRAFFKMLSSHCPVIVIAGNHDMIETNTNRLDSITPVIDDIKNLYYLKYSGIYHSKNTNHSFVVSSLYDKKFIRRSDIKGDQTRKYISLYHGTINISEDSEISSRHRLISDFDGFDAVLLGDIHKHQIIKSNMAYAGSLIQQNHGETLTGHGILVWDNELTPKLYEIQNQYGFVDIICDNGNWHWGSELIPEKCYARLIIKNCTSAQIDKIVSEVKKSVETLDISKKNCISEEITEFEIPPDIKRKEDEIELIKEQSKLKKYDELALTELHKYYQEKCDIDSSSIVTTVWKPLKLEFKNMFGYGGNTVNKINFKRGVTAIMANNAVGKTSIVNILLFSIFGKTPLNPGSASYTFDIINNKESSGYVKLLLKYGDKYYLIERKTIRKKSGKTTSAVLKLLNKYDFSCEIWESNIRGDKIKNCSELRKNNNDTFINELFGSIDDFSLCSLLNKESSMDLLSLSPTEQVKVLKRMFKMNIYDTYREFNKQKLAEIEQEIKKLKTKKDSILELLEPEEQTKDLGEYQNILVQLEKENQETQLKLNEIITELNTVTSMKQDLLSQINHNKSKISVIPQEGETIQELEKQYDDNPLITDTGKSKDYLLLMKNNLTKIITSQKPQVSEELIQNRISEITRLYTDIKPGISAPKESKSLLDKVYGQVSQILETIEFDSTQPRQNKEELNEEYKKIESKIIPLTSDLYALEKRKSDLEPLAAEFKSLNITELNRKVKELENEKAYCEKYKIEQMGDMGDTEDHGEIRDEYGYTMYEVDYSEISSCQDKKESIKKEIQKLENMTITDIKKYVTILNQVPFLDEDIKSMYSLPPDKKYCIIEEETINKLSFHLKNEGKRTDLIRKISHLKGEYEKYGSKIEEIKDKLSKNKIISNNIKIRGYQCQKRWDEICQELDELFRHIDQYKINQEVDEINRQISIHNNNSKYQDEMSKLKQDIKWYDVKEKYDRLNKKLDIINKKLAIYEFLKLEKDMDEIAESKKATKELPIIDDQLKKQIKWENNNIIRQKIDSYYLIEENKINELKIKEINQKIDMLVDAKNHNESMNKNHNDKISNIKEEIRIIKYKREQHKKFQKEITIIEEKIVKLEKDIQPVKDYNEIMGNKGIASKILFNKIKSIEEYINNIISKFTRYKVIILYDEKKQSINIVTRNKDTENYLSICRLSGYEKLMLQVSFKRALNKFSYNSKSSLIIIDEALDCIDQENFTSRLPDVINLVTQDYSTCLAISQRDIQHISDHIIRLQRDQNNVSYVGKII
jgi:DNA repair exonuclease SbcCD ATPase subunit